MAVRLTNQKFTTIDANGNRIIDVGTGSADTDAINKAQLDSVASDVSTNADNISTNADNISSNDTDISNLQAQTARIPGSNVWQAGLRDTYVEAQRVTDFIITRIVTETLTGDGAADREFLLTYTPTTELVTDFFLVPSATVGNITVESVDNDTVTLSGVIGDTNTFQITYITAEPVADPTLNPTVEVENGISRREYFRRRPDAGDVLPIIRPNEDTYVRGVDGRYIGAYWEAITIDGEEWRAQQEYLPGDIVGYLDINGIPRYAYSGTNHYSSATTNPAVFSAIGFQPAAFTDARPWEVVGSALDVSTGSVQDATAFDFLDPDGTRYPIAIQGLITGVNERLGQWGFQVGAYDGTDISVTAPSDVNTNVTISVGNGDIISFGLITEEEPTTAEFEISDVDTEDTTRVYFTGAIPLEIQQLFDGTGNIVAIYQAGARADLGQANRLIFADGDFVINTVDQSIGHAHISLVDNVVNSTSTVTANPGDTATNVGSVDANGNITVNIDTSAKQDKIDAILGDATPAQALDGVITLDLYKDINNNAASDGVQPLRVRGINGIRVEVGDEYLTTGFHSEITIDGTNVPGHGINVETTFPGTPGLGDQIFLDVAVSATDGTNQRARGFYTYVQPSADPATRFWEQLTTSAVGQLYNNARVGDIIYLQYAEEGFNTTDNDFIPGFYRANGNVGDDNHTTWIPAAGEGVTGSTTLVDGSDELRSITIASQGVDTTFNILNDEKNTILDHLEVPMTIGSVVEIDSTIPDEDTRIILDTYETGGGPEDGEWYWRQQEANPGSGPAATIFTPTTWQDLADRPNDGETNSRLWRQLIVQAEAADAAKLQEIREGVGQYDGSTETVPDADLRDLFVAGYNNVTGEVDLNNWAVLRVISNPQGTTNNDVRFRIHSVTSSAGVPPDGDAAGAANQSVGIVISHISDTVTTTVTNAPMRDGDPSFQENLNITGDLIVNGTVAGLEGETVQVWPTAYTEDFTTRIGSYYEFNDRVWRTTEAIAVTSLATLTGSNPATDGPWELITKDLNVIAGTGITIATDAMTNGLSVTTVSSDTVLNRAEVTVPTERDRILRTGEVQNLDTFITDGIARGLNLVIPYDAGTTPADGNLAWVDNELGPFTATTSFDDLTHIRVLTTDPDANLYLTLLREPFIAIWPDADGTPDVTNWAVLQPTGTFDNTNGFSTVVNAITRQLAVTALAGEFNGEIQTNNVRLIHDNAGFIAENIIRFIEPTFNTVTGVNDLLLNGGGVFDLEETGIITVSELDNDGDPVALGNTNTQFTREGTGNQTHTVHHQPMDSMAYLALQFNSVFAGVRGQVTDPVTPQNAAITDNTRDVDLHVYIEYLSTFNGESQDVTFVDRVRLSDGETQTRMYDSAAPAAFSPGGTIINQR